MNSHFPYHSISEETEHCEDHTATHCSIGLPNILPKESIAPRSAATTSLLDYIQPVLEWASPAVAMMAVNFMLCSTYGSSSSAVICFRTDLDPKVQRTSNWIYFPQTLLRRSTGNLSDFVQVMRTPTFSPIFPFSDSPQFYYRSRSSPETALSRTAWPSVASHSDDDADLHEQSSPPQMVERKKKETCVDLPWFISENPLPAVHPGDCEVIYCSFIELRYGRYEATLPGVLGTCILGLDGGEDSIFFHWTDNAALCAEAPISRDGGSSRVSINLATLEGGNVLNHHGRSDRDAGGGIDIAEPIAQLCCRTMSRPPFTSASMTSLRRSSFLIVIQVCDAFLFSVVWDVYDVESGGRLMNRFVPEAVTSATHSATPKFLLSTVEYLRIGKSRGLLR
ncbi:hypothetical protein B0H11DRAFT_1927950 [Mycena galericulata]|nr:hypothetical protein B0H11DRAFT_1927950 [Mycena galericulata]